MVSEKKIHECLDEYEGKTHRGIYCSLQSATTNLNQLNLILKAELIFVDSHHLHGGVFLDVMSAHLFQSHFYIC